jgi:hypothetical protein
MLPPLTPDRVTLSSTDSRAALLEGSWTHEHQHRIKRIEDRYGFLVHSIDEANVVIALHAREEHCMQLPLMDYYNQQIDHRRDGKATVQAITEGFIQSASTALNETDYAHEVIVYLQGLTIDDASLTFGDVYPVDEWADNPTTVAHLSSLTRRAETTSFVNSGGQDTLVPDYLLDTRGVRERLDRITVALGSLTASQLLKLAQGMRRAEDQRFDYWYQRLHEAAGHAYVREQATIAIHDLDAQSGASKNAQPML